MNTVPIWDAPTSTLAQTCVLIARSLLVAELYCLYPDAVRVGQRLRARGLIHDLTLRRHKEVPRNDQRRKVADDALTLHGRGLLRDEDVLAPVVRRAVVLARRGCF